MTRGVIDLGTNTVLMVIGKRDENGSVEVLADYHEVGRLGKGVDETGTIQPETFDRIASILERYRRIARDHGTEEILGYGTSALRDAANREEFIAAMNERTGVRLRILSGSDEARLTWCGALFGLDIAGDDVTVLDIGGGSTEIARGIGGTYTEGRSIDVGAVRVTERFFRRELPPSPEGINEARNYCRALFGEAIALPGGTDVVGVAGTVTTLGAIFRGIERFDTEAINGTRLEREWIREKTEELLRMPMDELQKIPQIVSGREDIISGGVLVLDAFMEAFNIDGIVVSTRGLRYGLLERLGTSGTEPS